MGRPTSTRRELIASGGTLVLAGLAGCSTSASGGVDEVTTTEPSATDSHDDGHSHDHESSLDGPSEHATVTVQSIDDGHHFSPHVVWVEAGGTVTWKLKSGTHTATAYAPDNDKPRRIPEGAESFASGSLSEQGETFERTFETEGVYDYYCVPHEALGMIGTVIVGEPDPHDQPGLAAPQESLPKEARSKIERLNHQVNEALGHTHGEETTESEDHHDGTTTDDSHHDDGHHDGTTTDDSHHDDG